jgi:hypothetical protein
MPEARGQELVANNKKAGLPPALLFWSTNFNLEDAIDWIKKPGLFYWPGFCLFLN